MRNRAVLAALLLHLLLPTPAAAFWPRSELRKEAAERDVIFDAPPPQQQPTVVPPLNLL